MDIQKNMLEQCVLLEHTLVIYFLKKIWKIKKTIKKISQFLKKKNSFKITLLRLLKL